MSGSSGLRATRRGFLRLAGGTGALAGLAQLRALPADAAGEAPTGGAPFFAAREREILTRIVERMVDTGEPGAPAVRDTGAIDTIDRLCRALDPALTAPLPALVRLVEWGPLLFDGRLARFSSLDEAGRDAHLAGWMQSRIGLRRLAFLALRNLALLGYWSQDATWPLIGYRGPLIGRGAVAS
ncbi:MAG: hypothetical protein OZ948_14200 [Deltaproteobacteria bacterium]|nr:hypothetical protein [Deltaproteobacteria bacterium]